MPIPTPPPAPATSYAAQWLAPADGQVTIGDVTMGLNVATPPDEHGITWKLSRFDGWEDGWEGQPASEQRVSAHGSWPSPVWASERLVQAEGSLQAPSWDEATKAWRRLNAHVPLSDLTTMTVFIGNGDVAPLQADVRQGGKPLITSRVAGRLGFSIALTAPDPRRYGVEEQIASTGLPITTGGLSLPLSLPLSVGATVQTGRVTVTNDGNELAPVVLEVMGPAPACTVTNLATGQRLFIPEAVPAGRTLVLDSDRRTALLDAASSRTVTGTWFDLVPGANEIAFGAVAYDPAARLTIRHRHAWR